MIARPVVAETTQPEGMEAGTCRWCGVAVWWATTVAGQRVALSVDPDRGESGVAGTIEMVLVEGVWYAEELAQTEFLFDVGRERWSLHSTACRRPVKRGSGFSAPAQPVIPAQRSSRS